MPSTRNQNPAPTKPRSSVVLVKETRPRATKSHICLVCDGTIAKGEPHICVVYHDKDALNGGRFRRARTHLTCPKVVS